MKKIMLAIAIAASAVIAQAASFNWTTTGTNASKTFYGSDGSSTIAGMTVYLMDAATVSQGDLVTALRGGSSITDYTSVAKATLNTNSRLDATVVSYGEVGNFYDFYMAIVQDDYVFVSATVNATGQFSDTQAVTFSGVKTATQTVFADVSTAYSTAGWYQTAPEPTSGLLLLIGMAGLALKRKRA